MKTFLCSFCLLATGFIFSNYAQGPSSSDKNYSTFRVNNSHTGVFLENDVKHPDGFSWIFKTKGPIRSTPTVSNDLVFVGSCDSYLYAISLATGKEKWKFNTGSAIPSSPCILGNKIYFSSRSGNLYSLDLQTGKEIWEADLGRDIPYSWGFDYYISSPVIDENNIYIGSGNGEFYSINDSTGKIEWKYNCNSRIRSTAAIINNYVLFGDMDGTFYALNKNNGILIWQFQVDGKKFNNKDFGFDRRAILGSPAVTENKVVFGSRDGNLYAVNLEDGKEDWKFSHGTSWVITSPAIYKNVIYAGSSDAHFVQALDLKTGKELWRFNTKQAVWASPAVTENNLYFADFSGTVYSLNRKLGTENWSQNLMDGFITSSPIIVNNKILIGGDDGKLYCLEGSNNKSEPSKVKRTVYWDETKGYKWFQNNVDKITRDYFESAGYKVLDKNSLSDFFKEEIKTKSPSVVVFASNNIPSTVYSDSTKNYLIKAYLLSGGKVVFLGPNPLAFVFDNKTEKLKGIDFRIPTKLFNIDYKGELTDAMKGWFYSRTTKEGEKWGLTGWWVGIASVDTNQVDEVLALDENGNASAWAKNFGGPKGTGLIQLWIDKSVPQDLSKIKLAAEYGF